MGGIAAARGRFIIMGDADDSYDFAAILPFLAKLREGYDLVMGNRFKGGIQPGAMPALHRYFGNPVLTGIGRLLFRSPSGDFHCGMRVPQRQAREPPTDGDGLPRDGGQGDLAGTGCRMPTMLSRDSRSRPPHLPKLEGRLATSRTPVWHAGFPLPGPAAHAGGLGRTLDPPGRARQEVTFDVTMLYAAPRLHRIPVVCGLHQDFAIIKVAPADPRLGGSSVHHLEVG
jgi:hypothetical protein